ncbi:hypothetical protein B0T14DRAFT_42233 [Immersiella caudata]|uniref:Secreted protein n=1 Tax=Immersiella caudata TaxID=314043 RepID=A0AA40CCW4_9PEZI|nr:hypothetical protein B0T14DRAFT_42233 [Immersiella caudata]
MLVIVLAILWEMFDSSVIATKCGDWSRRKWTMPVCWTMESLGADQMRSSKPRIRMSRDTTLRSSKPRIRMSRDTTLSLGLEDRGFKGKSGEVSGGVDCDPRSLIGLKLSETWVRSTDPCAANIRSVGRLAHRDRSCWQQTWSRKPARRDATHPPNCWR